MRRALTAGLVLPLAAAAAVGLSGCKSNPDCTVKDFAMFYYGGTGHMHGSTTAGLTIACTGTPQHFNAQAAIFARVKEGGKWRWLRASKWLVLHKAGLPPAGSEKRYHLHGLCWKNTRERVHEFGDGVSSTGQYQKFSYFDPNRFGKLTRACDKGD